jgi:Cu-Zn family superoxide dismutase
MKKITWVLSLVAILAIGGVMTVTGQEGKPLKKIADKVEQSVEKAEKKVEKAVEKATGKAADAAHGHDHEAALPKRGICLIVAKEDSKVAGVVEFVQHEKTLHLTGEITGLSPGEHGFHIHEFGDLRDPKGMSTGGHFNPKGHKHGALGANERHEGDLGNVKANEAGVAKVDVKVEGLSLHFVLGRSLVVHAKPDDYSQPTGNAGPRVGVGVIAIAAEPKK